MPFFAILAFILSEENTPSPKYSASNTSSPEIIPPVLVYQFLGVIFGISCVVGIVFIFSFLSWKKYNQINPFANSYNIIQPK